MQAIADVLAAADIQVTPVADARMPIWDKFVYLVAVLRIHRRGAAADRRHLEAPARAGDVLRRSREIAAIAAAEGVTISADRFDTLKDYMDNIPPTTRSSLLIDLEQGKRIEVEALQGAAFAARQKHGVPVPIISTLYALLKPWENGPLKS